MTRLRFVCALLALGLLVPVVAESESIQEKIDGAWRVGAAVTGAVAGAIPAWRARRVLGRDPDRR